MFGFGNNRRLRDLETQATQLSTQLQASSNECKRLSDKLTDVEAASRSARELYKKADAQLQQFRDEVKESLADLEALAGASIPSKAVRAKANAAIAALKNIASPK